MNLSQCGTIHSGNKPSSRGYSLKSAHYGFERERGRVPHHQVKEAPHSKLDNVLGVTIQKAKHET
jgi:hypothetical protein